MTELLAAQWLIEIGLWLIPALLTLIGGLIAVIWRDGVRRMDKFGERLERFAEQSNGRLSAVERDVAALQARQNSHRGYQPIAAHAAAEDA